MIRLNLDAIDDLILNNNDGETITDVETVKNAEGEVISITEKKFAKPPEMNPIKYDIINQMVLSVMGYLEECDSSLGIEHAIDNAPLMVKTAFNTLEEYDILIFDYNE